jgi:hypothetical protein
MDEDRTQMGPAARAGMSVPEYEARAWDMARNLVHPAAFYVVIQVVGLTRLTAHPVFREPGAGWLELALFVASFLGAWAVFYSTMLRDAGLRSLTVTFLVPLAFLALVVGWVALPAVVAMSDRDLATAALALVAPGPVAWIVTMVRWSRARREMAAMLDVTRDDAA